MRISVVLLAMASLLACSPEQSGVAKAEAAEGAVVPAALTFEGAAAPGRAAMLAHGERLSHIVGCTGCHTATLEGKLFNEDAPELGKLYASNLTRVMPTMSDAQLEALLRTGKHPTRGDMWIMPSEIFQRLSDADMKALIAHLRTVKPSGEATPPPALSELAQKLVADGKLKPTSGYIAEYRDKLPPDLGADHAFGRYLAGATCAECHGADLTGNPEFGPGIVVPDLDIVGTYSDAEMTTLLTKGVGKTRKDLGLMTIVGEKHFAYLTPRERSALIAYLRARAERKVAAR
ncbi:c-type cytochrome [Sphingomonas sp. LY29]|uniref:c-type cytochrome n=1 Tax=Sphingomonas sp. LY29 TaxID=3095341 RepID=UPI002D77CAFA|nr:c-type cytochrome [Sphingomonas sp. LY29]WRP25684.1 c-type cytochrome [Sphingomonas sp. LY29]